MGEPASAPAVVTVRWRHLDDDDESLHSLLDENERARWTAYRREPDRARFRVGVALLRAVVATEDAIPVEQVRLDRRCPTCARPHGRPRVTASDLQVSVSHAFEHIVVASTRARPLGIDVERVDARAADEVAAVALHADETWRDAGEFTTHWVRKEAMVKATGDGLTVALPEVRLGQVGEAPRLVSYPGGLVPARVEDLPAPAGFRAALAVLGSAPIAVRTVSRAVCDH